MHLPALLLLVVAAEPTPEVEVMGTLDKAEIIKVVSRQRDDVRRCDERARASAPNLSGAVTVRLIIGPTGKVTMSSIWLSTAKHEGLEQCLVASTRAWTFPKPPGGGVVIVRYPFTFPPG